METRPSSAVGVRWQPFVLVVLALVGAWLLGHYSGDSARAELTLDQPLTPLAQAATQPAAPAQSQMPSTAAAPVPGATSTPSASSAPTRVTQQPALTSALATTSGAPAPTATSSSVAPTKPAGDTASATPPSTTTPPADPSDTGTEPTPPDPPPAPATSVPSDELASASVVASADATSAHVTWETNFPTTSQGAEGTGAAPSVWAPSQPTPTSTHAFDFTDLSPATTYHLWLHDVDEWNRPLTTQLTVTTAPRTGTTAATVGNGSILLNGQPFFPLTTWSTCTNTIPDRIGLGFNLFMGEGCGHEQTISSALGGKAVAVVNATTKLANQPGVIGWYYPDELDGRVSLPLSPADVTSMAVTPPDGMLSFLTLTNHFFSGAAPLSIGRSLYPAFASIANVIGFDLYPLQNWCRNDAFQSVYDAQRELDTLAAGKPTFQWIEARKMDCSAALSPTPQTVAAETWLAIAGGADGIGYFPDEWSADVGTEIGALNTQITDLAPALLAPEVTASAPAAVKVGAHTLNGALYVIAVNSSTSPFDVQLQVDGAGSRTFDVLGEGRQVTAADNAISDHFGGLGVHIYVSAPDGWTQTSTQTSTPH